MYENINEAFCFLNLAWDDYLKDGTLNASSKFNRAVKDLFSEYVVEDEMSFINNSKSIYQYVAKRLVDHFGKSNIKFRASYWESDLTMREAKSFKKFLIKHGQRFKRTYNCESHKRAFTFTGRGEYKDFTFMFVTRQKLNAGLQSTGHSRDIDLVLINCNVHCFYKGMNLLGNKNVTWRDFLHLSPEEIIAKKNISYEQYSALKA